MPEVKLYLGDCLTILPTLADNSIDAVVTDPPFGTGMAEWDKEPDSQAWAEMRRLCPDGPIAVMGYAKQLMRWSQYFDGLNLIGYIVWHKYNEPVPSPGLTRIHQDIAIWGKSHKQVKADKVREPYSKLEHLADWYSGKHGEYHGDLNDFGKRLRNAAYENNRNYRNPNGRRCTDLWRIPAPGAGFNSHLRRHTNEKPLELFRRLTLLLTDEGQTVLDPYLGSGTSGEAALITGRNFIGIEIVPKYYAIAECRIAEAQQQLALPLGA